MWHPLPGTPAKMAPAMQTSMSTGYVHNAALVGHEADYQNWHQEDERDGVQVIHRQGAVLQGEWVNIQKANKS